MKNLIPALVLSAYSLWPFVLSQFPALPPDAKFVPDLTIAVAAALLVPRLLATGAWATIQGKYILVFALFAYVVVSGIVLNGVSAETTFSGIRTYFRFVPLF